jgi:hypothetical protein
MANSRRGCAWHCRHPSASTAGSEPRQPGVVDPVDSVQGREVEIVESSPSPFPANQFGLEQADDALGHRAVIGVPDAADRGERAGLGEPLGIADRVLRRPLEFTRRAAFTRSRQRCHLITDGVFQEAVDATDLRKVAAMLLDAAARRALLAGAAQDESDGRTEARSGELHDLPAEGTGNIKRAIRRG